MNILYVASEVAPFAVSGGLGDVMGALPQTIKTQLDKLLQFQQVMKTLVCLFPTLWKR